MPIEPTPRGSRALPKVEATEISLVISAKPGHTFNYNDERFWRRRLQRLAQAWADDDQEWYLTIKGDQAQLYYDTNREDAEQ